MGRYPFRVLRHPEIRTSNATVDCETARKLEPRARAHSPSVCQGERPEGDHSGRSSSGLQVAGVLNPAPVSPTHSGGGHSTTTRRHRWLRRTLIATVVLVVLLGLYVAFVRPWHVRWGASPEEVARALPGDSLVQGPQEVTTRAITINAWPAHIWPWLAQMGNGRGGLYSYDWLDRVFGVLDANSSDTLIARFQQIRPGDTIPIGGSTGWPVAIARPNDILLLDVREAGAHVTWVFALAPISPTKTRLIMRVRARLPVTWRLPLQRAVLDPAEFLMVRRQLMGIRDRAEQLARADSAYIRARPE